jgi:hypothetical protein
VLTRLLLAFYKLFPATQFPYKEGTMLFRKVVCMSLLSLVAFTVPVASQRLVELKKPVLQADGTDPEPPPIVLSGFTVAA